MIVRSRTTNRQTRTTVRNPSSKSLMCSPSPSQRARSRHVGITKKRQLAVIELAVFRKARYIRMTYTECRSTMLISRLWVVLTTAESLIDLGIYRFAPVLLCFGGRFSHSLAGRRDLMSTAGKVLVVLIMLASLVWMVLMAGVAQLNRTGNKTLQELGREDREAHGRCPGGPERNRQGQGPDEPGSKADASRTYGHSGSPEAMSSE